jgi:hypothetical protein
MVNKARLEDRRMRRNTWREYCAVGDVSFGMECGVRN